MPAIPSANFTATIRNTNGAPVVRIADTTPYPTVGGTAETRATVVITFLQVPARSNGSLPWGFSLFNVVNGDFMCDVYMDASIDTLPEVATATAAEINSSGTYTAVAAGDSVIITFKPGAGASPNGTLVGSSGLNLTNPSTFVQLAEWAYGVNAVPADNTVEDAIGYVTVTQPDGITINIGSFDSPSIAWASGAQTIAEGVLRLATDSSFQNGTYSITMHTRLAGYDDTVTTKTFVLDYSKPVAVLQPAFDLFTPSIRMQDSTSYAVSGLTLQSVTRSWTGNVVSVGAVSAGNVNPFDMVRSGNYYDALYTATLTAVAQWQITAATWVTVIDTIVGTESEDAHGVATPDELITLLNSMFDNLSGDSLCACSSQREQYVFAKTVFDHLMQRGRCGNTGQLYDMYRKLRMAINPNWTIATHDQSVLTAYDFNDFCGV